MSKLEFIKKIKAEDTISRTIRMGGTTFDQITELAEKNDMSFNAIACQLIEHALKDVNN